MVTITFVLLLSACGSEKIETNMSSDVADFEFTTQDNEQFGLKDLKGEWWAAYFMYTECTMVCPTTTPNMVDIQEQLHESGLELPIVSFTVDPGHDTPDVLKTYAKENKIDVKNWSLLTGYDFEEIKKLSEGSFKSVLEDGGTGEMEMVHSTLFFLINPDGKVVKKYDGLSQKELDVFVHDAQAVLSQ